MNLAIHILAGLTLFGIARRTLEGPLLRAAYSGRAGGAPPRAGEQRGRDDLAPSWGAAAVLSCALGMASKVVMVTAPAAVLLYDRSFLCTGERAMRPGPWRELWRRRGLLHLALFSTWGIPLFLFAGRAELFGPEVGFGVEGIPPLAYALTQPGVILHYLRLSVWPHPLVLDYGWPLARTAREILPPLAAVGGVLAATGWALLRRPAAGFLGAWFFLILAPTSSFIPILDPSFEHRMYLPLAAVIAGAVLATARLLALTAGGAGARAGGALALTAVLLLGAATLRRNHDYRSFLSIWADTAWKRPLNPRARSNHGAALYLEGRAGHGARETGAR